MLKQCAFKFVKNIADDVYKVDFYVGGMKLVAKKCNKVWEAGLMKMCRWKHEISDLGEVIMLNISKILGECITEEKRERESN